MEQNLDRCIRLLAATAGGVNTSTFLCMIDEGRGREGEGGGTSACMLILPILYNHHKMYPVYIRYHFYSAYLGLPVLAI